MTSKQKLYLVQRLAWCPVHDEDFGRSWCDQHEIVEGTPVLALVTRAEAVRHALELTAEARREINPFQFSNPSGFVGIRGGNEDDLMVALVTLGLPSPPQKIRTPWGEYLDWVRWYDNLADTLSDSERNAIWNLLDRLELYRVVEVEFFV